MKLLFSQYRVCLLRIADTEWEGLGHRASRFAAQTWQLNP